MTNETREREGLFRADTEAAAWTDSEGRRAGGAGMSDRAPVGTATATQATADRSEIDRMEQVDRGGQDTASADGDAERADRDGSETGDRERVAGKTRTPDRDDSRRLGSDPKGAPDVDSLAEPTDSRVVERLRAVERAITGTDGPVADLGDEAAAAAERDALSEQLDELESRVTELEAATQAIRGYVGSVRSVNEAVERRADLALAEARKNRANAAGDDASSDGGTGAADGQTPEGEAGRRDARSRTGAATDEADSGTVPDEGALDAALPGERSGEAGPNVSLAATAPTPDRVDDAADETGDGSWCPAALARLRESF